MQSRDPSGPRRNRSGGCSAAGASAIRRVGSCASLMGPDQRSSPFAGRSQLNIFFPEGVLYCTWLIFHPCVTELRMLATMPSERYRARIGRQKAPCRCWRERCRAGGRTQKSTSSYGPRQSYSARICQRFRARRRNSRPARSSRRTTSQWPAC